MMQREQIQQQQQQLRSSVSPFVFYRLSSVGKALLSSLDSMVQEGIIDGRAAAEILVH